MPYYTKRVDSIVPQKSPQPTSSITEVTIHHPKIIKKPSHSTFSRLKPLFSVLFASIIVASNLLLFTTVHTNQLFTVRSGSMEPAIQTGSVILVNKSKLAAIPYKVGDVITFQGVRQTITHRVTEVLPHGDSYQYRTKGDANNIHDNKLVPHKDVIGHTSIHIPFIGYLLAWLKTTAGFATIILLPATFVVLQELRKIRHAWKELSMRRFSAPQLTTSMAAALLVTATISTPLAYAAFSDSATIQNNHFATAPIFPSPSPTPTVSPSPTATPSVTPTPSPTPTTSPSPTPEATPSPSPEVDGTCDLSVTSDMSNTNTGPDSTNVNELDVDHDCEIDENNSLEETTNIDVSANTGNNTSTDNTSGGSINTGDISLQF